MKTRTEVFELMIDGTRVEVKATPYFINHNMGKRIRVSYNGSPVHIFAWDDSVNRLHAVKEGSENIPHKIETAIARELENGSLRKIIYIMFRFFNRVLLIGGTLVFL